MASGLIVCCLPVMPRLFRREESKPKPSHSYQTSKTAHSRKRYVEMNDLTVDHLSETSRANLNQSSFAEWDDEHEFQQSAHSGNGSQRPAILKTISIRQTTDV